MGIYNATLPTLADGQHVEDQVDANGRRLTAGQTATATARLLSAAASTNATSVKASAGVVAQISGYNASTAARFLKIYDKASAPTVGTDTPRMTLYLPPGAAFVFDCCDSYTLGIAFAITTSAADADTGALTAGDIICLNVDYR